jgi:hypothetical protein
MINYNRDNLEEGIVMSEEVLEETDHQETSNKYQDFNKVKKVASKNIVSMLKDLHDFEAAIETENIPEIYRIYKGKLHKELKETSNQNHEIDELLSTKLHDKFVERFPFMEYVEKISPTIYYYKIGTYYRERATIGFDASIPEIFVLPKIDDEWQHYRPDNRELLEAIEKQIDNLDAKIIAAEEELKNLEKEAQDLSAKKEELSNSKSFFNRAKTEEEVEQLNKQIAEINKKKTEWLPFIKNKNKSNQQKEQLMRTYEETRLKRAVVTKEYRFINQYFGSIKEMNEQIQQFLADYLSPKKGELDK